MIDHDAFVQWAESRFDNIHVDKDEVKVRDIWWVNDYGEPDNDNKCWVNTTKGCYHALKSRRHGSAIALVVEVDKCTWEEAAQTLGCEYTPEDFESKLEALFRKEHEQEVAAAKQVELPPFTYALWKLSPENPIRARAEAVLVKRKIPIDGLYICADGEYRNRIIIPYYDKEGKLIYWNGRDITDRAKAKYRGPDKDLYNIGKGDVLWMNRWLPAGTDLYVTEGEFDAMSLSLSGLNGAACGSKNVSEKQLNMMFPYKVTFCFDNDKAGEEWLEVANTDPEGSGVATAFSLRNASFVRPPVGFKDWNDLLIKTNEKIVKAYVLAEKKPLTLDAINALRMSKI